VVLAEWTKLRTLPSTGWLALAIAGSTFGVGAAAIGGLQTTSCPLSGCPQDLVRFSLNGVWVGQAVVALLAVLAVTNEYSTGMIQVSVMSCPRRWLMLAAKAATVTGIAVVTGGAGALGSLLFARTVLPGNGFPVLSLTDEPTLRAGLGTALYFGLIALLGIGVGLVVRDTAGSITGVLGLLYASPILVILIPDRRWRERLQEYSPSAGLSIQATKRLDLLPIGPWEGLAVLGCYAAVTLAAGLLLLHARDA
jgi:ABC-2 type transport system permease protein